jgi:predicted glycosyltransferase
MPPGTDLVKLPSVVKEGAGVYRSRDLHVSFPRIKKIRRDLIRGTAEAFRPDLFMVDNVPLGMKGEVLPTLRHLRAASPSCRIVLNLRDILDDPQTIRASWEAEAVPEALSRLYDRIFILGDPTLFDAAAAYDLPPEKALHVGYAAPLPRRVRRPSRTNGKGPHILFTVGGGGDGSEFLDRALQGMTRMGGAKARIEVVTGPLMDPTERVRLAERAQAAGAEIHEFVPDLTPRMLEADLVVAMAGYNTCCEILSHARAALLFPRVTPRVEQLLRAEAFEQRRLAAMLPPDTDDPAAIAGAIEGALSQNRAIAETDLPAMDGLRRLAENLADLCPELDRMTERSPEAGEAEPRRDAPSRMERRGGALTPAARFTNGAAWYWPGVALGAAQS